MDFAPIYLLQRFFYAIFNFFHHWYVDGSRAIAKKFLLTLKATDQPFAKAVICALACVISAVVYFIWYAIPIAILWYVITGIV